jgi:putative two-component system response regulator
MSRILVIDDEYVVRNLIVEILETAGHDVVAADSPEVVLSLLEQQDDFSLVVSDIVMPGLSGLDLLEAVRARRPSLPVVLVTGAGTYENLSRALTRGAAGLVTKPFSHTELQTAVADAIERATKTEEDLRERLLTPTLASALANAIEARDNELSGHCERLATLAVRIAEDLHLAHAQIEAIRLGAILHEVGKIGIPDSFLLKPAALDDDERALIETHPLVGDAILEPLDLLATVRPIVRHHHERWDGAWYPDRLAGEEIPLGARIVAVSDGIEVMSSRKLYRQPLDAAQIVEELRRCRGGQWDPEVVDIALKLIESGELRLAATGLRLVERDAAPAAPDVYSVLLVETDVEEAPRLAAALERGLPGVRVSHAADAACAAELCRSSMWSLAIVDDRLPDGTRIDLLELLGEQCPDVPIVLITGSGRNGTAVEAYRLGASDFVVRGSALADDLTRRARGLLAA